MHILLLTVFTRSQRSQCRLRLSRPGGPHTASLTRRCKRLLLDTWKTRPTLWRHRSTRSGTTYLPLPRRPARATLLRHARARCCSSGLRRASCSCSSSAVSDLVWCLHRVRNGSFDVSMRVPAGALAARRRRFGWTRATRRSPGCAGQGAGVRGPRDGAVGVGRPRLWGATGGWRRGVVAAMGRRWKSCRLLRAQDPH